MRSPATRWSLAASAISTVWPARGLLSTYLNTSPFGLAASLCFGPGGYDARLANGSGPPLTARFAFLDPDPEQTSPSAYGRLVDDAIPRSHARGRRQAGPEEQRHRAIARPRRASARSTVSSTGRSACSFTTGQRPRGNYVTVSVSHFASIWRPRGELGFTAVVARYVLVTTSPEALPRRPGYHLRRRLCLQLENATVLQRYATRPCFRPHRLSRRGRPLPQDEPSGPRCISTHHRWSELRRTQRPACGSIHGSSRRSPTRVASGARYHVSSCAEDALGDRPVRAFAS